MTAVGAQEEVRLSRNDDLWWLVWFRGRVVGRFTLLREALDLTEMLECSPRARAAVAADPEAPT